MRHSFDNESGGVTGCTALWFFGLMRCAQCKSFDRGNRFSTVQLVKNDATPFFWADKLMSEKRILGAAK
jgi:hypothetical protein